jgi:hypothetical protein
LIKKKILSINKNEYNYLNPATKWKKISRWIGRRPRLEENIVASEENIPVQWCISKDSKLGQVITLTGDQRENVLKFLIEEQINRADEITIKGT